MKKNKVVNDNKFNKKRKDSKKKINSIKSRVKRNKRKYTVYKFKYGVWSLIIVSIILVVLILLLFLQYSISLKDNKDNEIVNNNINNEMNNNINHNIILDDIEFKYIELEHNIDKFKHSIDLSKEIYSDGSEFVILVDVEDTFSEYLACNLSGFLKAPILFFNSEGIDSETINEIKRLNSNSIYAIGNEISDDIENVIRDTFDIQVNFVDGKDKYELSNNVMNETLLYNTDSVAVVMDEEYLSVSSDIFGKLNIPILYVNQENYNDYLNNYFNNNKGIKKIYISGDVVSSNLIHKLKIFDKNIDLIQGTNVEEYNANLIKKFNIYYKNIIFINDLENISIATLDALKNDSVLFYYKDDLSSVYLETIDYLSLENIYYFDNADYFKIRNALYSIKKDKIIKNDLSYYDMLFSNSKAVFYVPHQDDETLFYAQTITAAIEKLGEDNVYVVLVTDGNASQTQLSKKIQDSIKTYNKVHSLDLNFYQARDEEYVNALKELGVKNIQFIEDYGFNRFPDAGFKKTDKNYNKYMKSLKEFMIYMDDKFESDVSHFAYTYFDVHTDHLALGETLRTLYFDDSFTLDKFDDVYLIIKSTEMLNKNTHVLPNRMSKNPYRKIKIPDKYLIHLEYSKDFDKIKKAFNRYGYYSSKNPCVFDENTLGIGCTSVGYLFDNIYQRLDVNAKEPLVTPIQIPYR